MVGVALTEQQRQYRAQEDLTGPIREELHRLQQSGQVPSDIQMERIERVARTAGLSTEQITSMKQRALRPRLPQAA